MVINKKYKYPRTYHLPFSEGLQNDDKKIDSLERFIGNDIIVSEKLDGENSNLYPDGIHARSIDSVDHPSRHWLKGLWGSIKYLIPDGWRICGENMYAKHSIKYDDLKTYFYVFNVWDEENNCLSWDSTIDMCEVLGLETVPVLYEGKYDEKVLRDIANNIDINKREGFVVRFRDKFHYSEFHECVAKWVRPNHVQENSEHWMSKPIEKNELNEGNTE